MAAQNDDLNQLILDALGSDRSSLAPKKVKDRDVIPASEIQSLEKKYKVSFNKNTTSPLVYGDLTLAYTHWLKESFINAGLNNQSGLT